MQHDEMMSGASLPRRILVGVSCEPEDDSVGVARADRHAFQQGAWLAQRTGAALRAFHVTDFLDEHLARGSDKVQEIIHESMRLQLDAMCGKAAVSRVSTSYGFASGKPWLELLREAHRWGADLIIVSPKRDEINLANRLLHGSTARRVIRKAQAPVWVVHPGPSLGMEHVLACVDGSDVSADVVAMAGRIADLGNAKRTVLRCLDYPDDIALRRLVHADEALRAYHREVQDSAQAELDALAADAGGKWQIVLEDRYVADAVPERVKSSSVDLVVLASTSRPAVAGMVLGTTAERILERAPVSTLIVRPQDWNSPMEFED
jgi:nucleotide-binding universal stress UspA family protein